MDEVLRDALTLSHGPKISGSEVDFAAIDVIWRLFIDYLLTYPSYISHRALGLTL